MTQIGPKSPTIAANIDIGEINWSNLTNVYVSDNTYTTAALVNSTITLRAYICKNSSTKGNAGSDYTLTTSDYILTDGGSGSLWGLSWTAADIKNSNFGVQITAWDGVGNGTNYIYAHGFDFSSLPDGGIINGIETKVEVSKSSSTARIDSITVSVWYTSQSPPSATLVTDRLASEPGSYGNIYYNKLTWSFPEFGGSDASYYDLDGISPHSAIWYKIYRSLSESGPWTLLGITQSRNNVFFDSATPVAEAVTDMIIPNTVYYYKVRVSSIAGDSSAYSPVTRVKSPNFPKYSSPGTGTNGWALTCGLNIYIGDDSGKPQIDVTYINGPANSTIHLEMSTKNSAWMELKSWFVASSFGSTSLTPLNSSIDFGTEYKIRLTTRDVSGSITAQSNTVNVTTYSLNPESFPNLLPNSGLQYGFYAENVQSPFYAVNTAVTNGTFERYANVITNPKDISYIVNTPTSIDTTSAGTISLDFYSKKALKIVGESTTTNNAYTMNLAAYNFPGNPLVGKDRIYGFICRVMENLDDTAVWESNGCKLEVSRATISNNSSYEVLIDSTDAGRPIEDQGLATAGYVGEHGHVMAAVYSDPGSIDSSLPVTTTIYPSKDTWIDSTHPTTNYGGTTSIKIYGTAGEYGDGYNTLLYFDVSSIPEQSHITSAAIHLRLSSSAGIVQCGVYRITESWTEIGATWDNQPTYTQITSIPVPSFTIGGSVGWHVTSDLSAEIQAYVDGTIINNGIALMNDTGSVLGGGVYYSKEMGTDYKPYLTVTYATNIGNENFHNQSRLQLRIKNYSTNSVPTTPSTGYSYLFSSSILSPAFPPPTGLMLDDGDIRYFNSTTPSIVSNIFIAFVGHNGTNYRSILESLRLNDIIEIYSASYTHRYNVLGWRYEGVNWIGIQVSWNGGNNTIFPDNTQIHLRKADTSTHAALSEVYIGDMMLFDLSRIFGGNGGDIYDTTSSITDSTFRKLANALYGWWDFDYAANAPDIPFDIGSPAAAGVTITGELYNVSDDNGGMDTVGGLPANNYSARYIKMGQNFYEEKGPLANSSNSIFDLTLGGTADSTLDPSSTYQIGYLYTNSGGISGLSPTAYVTTSAFPEQVTNVEMSRYWDSVHGLSYLHITWSAVVEIADYPVTGYKIQYSSDGVTWTSDYYVYGRTTTYKNEASPPTLSNTVSKVYLCRVRAYNAMGNGEFSEIVSTVSVSLPTSPQNISYYFTDVTGETTNIVYEWEKPADDGCTITGEDGLVGYTVIHGTDINNLSTEIVSLTPTVTFNCASNPNPHFDEFDGDLPDPCFTWGSHTHTYSYTTPMYITDITGNVKWYDSRGVLRISMDKINWTDVGTINTNPASWGSFSFTGINANARYIQFYNSDYWVLGSNGTITCILGEIFQPTYTLSIGDNAYFQVAAITDYTNDITTNMGGLYTDLKKVTFVTHTEIVKVRGTAHSEGYIDFYFTERTGDGSYVQLAGHNGKAAFWRLTDGGAAISAEANIYSIKQLIEEEIAHSGTNVFENGITIPGTGYYPGWPLASLGKGPVNTVSVEPATDIFGSSIKIVFILSNYDSTEWDVNTVMTAPINSDVSTGLDGMGSFMVITDYTTDISFYKKNTTFVRPYIDFMTATTGSLVWTINSSIVYNPYLNKSENTPLTSKEFYIPVHGNDMLSDLETIINLPYGSTSRGVHGLQQQINDYFLGDEIDDVIGTIYSDADPTAPFVVTTERIEPTSSPDGKGHLKVNIKTMVEGIQNQVTCRTSNLKAFYLATRANTCYVNDMMYELRSFEDMYGRNKPGSSVVTSNQAIKRSYGFKFSLDYIREYMEDENSSIDMTPIPGASSASSIGLDIQGTTRTISIAGTRVDNSNYWMFHAPFEYLDTLPTSPTEGEIIQGGVIYMGTSNWGWCKFMKAIMGTFQFIDGPYRLIIMSIPSSLMQQYVPDRYCKYQYPDGTYIVQAGTEDMCYVLIERFTTTKNDEMYNATDYNLILRRVMALGSST